MINEKTANSYCCEDISKIENYNIAIADMSQTWHCHHRAEILPCGRFNIMQLKAMDMYWNRPANELVFLTAQEHMSLHKKGTKATDKTRIRQSKAVKAFYKRHPGYLKGRTPWNKGKHGVQTSWMKGKTMSDDMRRKISNMLKGNDPWNKGIAQEEKTKLKIRDSLRKIYPVRQLDVHGNIIAEYSSIFEAEEKTGIKVKYIKRVISGERRHHKGFIFEKMI